MNDFFTRIVTVVSILIFLFFIGPFILAPIIEQGRSSYFFSLITSILILGSIWNLFKGKIKPGVGLLFLAVFLFIVSRNIYFYH